MGGLFDNEIFEVIIWIVIILFLVSIFFGDGVDGV
ncbi:UNVERIFIED_CONTAM: putative membrane protein [Brevibacillus sp. OAP136]